MALLSTNISQIVKGDLGIIALEGGVEDGEIAALRCVDCSAVLSCVVAPLTARHAHTG